MKQLVAVFFGVGLVPFAQGTFASAVTILLAIAAFKVGGGFAISLAALAAIILGFWATYFSRDDAPQIVIDEVAGQLVAVLPVPLFIASKNLPNSLGTWTWLAAFLLFRLFDVWKPGMIRRIDRSGMPGSIMLDDLAAGITAAATLLVVWLLAETLVK